MLLGTAGFAIPALGLSAYLHFAYASNLGDLFDDARYPMEVFRFLPIYTLSPVALDLRSAGLSAGISSVMQAICQRGEVC